MITSVIALVVFGLLLYAGVAHLFHSSSFEQTLRLHRIWPARIVTPVLVATIVFELAVGVGGLAATVRIVPGEVTREGAFLAAGSLYLMYAAYGALLFHRGARVPCGCSSGDDPINAVTVGRSAVLAGLALTGPFHAPALIAFPSATAEYAVAVLASVAFGVMLWQLPATMAESFPGGRRVVGGANVV